MCVQWTNDWEVAAKDMVAYKIVVVSKGAFGRKTYESPCPVGSRNSQAGGPTGKVLQYKIGKKIESDVPGIYCLEHPVKLDNKTQVCLEVKIPKGARFRRGRASMGGINGQDVELQTINALCIQPKRVCDHKDEYPELRPTKPQYQAFYWNYAMTTSTSTNCIYYNNSF